MDGICIRQGCPAATKFKAADYTTAPFVNPPMTASYTVGTDYYTLVKCPGQVQGGFTCDGSAYVANTFASSLVAASAVLVATSLVSTI